MSVPRPLIQHSVLSRVAGALDQAHRKSEGLPAASVDDVLTLVAAIVCGGAHLLVDPTVHHRTMERTQRSATVLELELAPRRPSTTTIATATLPGGTMLAQESALGVTLAPVTAGRSYPRNGLELTSSHLKLAQRLANDVPASDKNQLEEDTWNRMATWLCEPSSDASWGNKLLAGLCRRDAEAAGRGESLTAQYLAELLRAAPDWEATPEAYWITNARVARFRSGFLPGIAREMGGMYYGPSSEDGIIRRVSFFDALAKNMLERSGYELDASHALADTAATRALAWAAVKPILDDGWNRTNPKELVQLAKQYALHDPAQLLSEAFQIELGQPMPADLVNRLAATKDKFVHPHRPRLTSIALGISAALVNGTVAYLSPPVLEHLTKATGTIGFGSPADAVFALLTTAVSGGVGYGVTRARRRHEAYDISAATIFRESLNATTRERVERKLNTELGIVP